MYIVSIITFRYDFIDIFRKTDCLTSMKLTHLRNFYKKRKSIRISSYAFTLLCVRLPILIQLRTLSKFTAPLVKFSAPLIIVQIPMKTMRFAKNISIFSGAGAFWSLSPSTPIPPFKK